MNGKIIFYWLATLGVCILMLLSAQTYLFDFDKAAAIFQKLNFPIDIIIPLAISKLLAVFAILWNKIKWIKEWAYAGLFFDMVLAIYAHAAFEKQAGWFAIVGLVLLLISYFLGKKVRP